MQNPPDIQTSDGFLQFYFLIKAFLITPNINITLSSTHTLLKTSDILS